jgi:diaminohydroxyphosphoribosylaminopyrimidine deaminase/5-amino-6-(5-phosphoribosylamino)uracil reductase
VLLALQEAGELPERPTIYTNADPWSDASDVEACVARLITVRPLRVVIGSSSDALWSSDESEQSSSPNLDRIRNAGIEVVCGVCEKPCHEINEAFFKYTRTGLPFVTIKYAQSLDGRIATATGDSRWISSELSLTLAHRLRHEHDAIMVGIGTVLADDPRLTVRLVEGRDPLRIIVDSRLRIPITARVLAEGAAHRTLVVTTEASDPRRVGELEQLGAEVLVLATGRNPSGVGLVDLLEALGQRRLGSILVEGGSRIITSFLASHAVDRIVTVVAPKIIGSGVDAVGDLDIAELKNAITFSTVKVRRLGPDVVFDCRI